jgi:hypothetical protein
MVRHNRDIRFVPKIDISVGSQKPSKEDITDRDLRGAERSEHMPCRASDSAHPFESASGKPSRAA